MTFLGKGLQIDCSYWTGRITIIDIDINHPFLKNYFQCKIVQTHGTFSQITNMSLPWNWELPLKPLIMQLSQNSHKERY